MWEEAGMSQRPRTPQRPARSGPREPIFNFSEPSPVRFAGLLIALHALFHYTPLSRSETLGSLVVLRPAEVTRGEGWLSAVGHAFAHSSWSHVLLNAAMLVVFAILTMRGARALAVRRGKPARAVLVWVGVFLLGALGGAFAQWGYWTVLAQFFLSPDAVYLQSAVGASGGVSALFASGAWAMGGRDTLVKFGIGWLIINVVMVVFESILGVGIAWPAHLGGYLTGAVFAPLWVAAGVTGFDPRN